MTRVLHVAESFGGGILEVVRLIAERGTAQGHPQAIAFGRRPETPDDVREAVAEPVELFDFGWGRRTLRSELGAARDLRRIAAAWQPDVIHLHSSFAGVVGGLALGRGRPTVYTPHALASELGTRSWASRRVYRAAERLAIRAATVVGAVSESEAAAVRRLGASAVVVVPNGIPELDAGARSLASTPPGARPLAVGLGRLVAQRRPAAVARILTHVRDVADVTWIGGGGEERLGSEEALRGLREAGIAPTGWLPRDDVLRRLSEATAYVHWTAIDGMSLSVLEAAAAGAVVIASDIPANQELLDARQLCRDEAAAAALLRRVVTEPGFAAELRAAQAQLMARYSADAMVGAWLDVYGRIAGEQVPDMISA